MTDRQDNPTLAVIEQLAELGVSSEGIPGQVPTPPAALTLYDEVVSQEIRNHTAALMHDWREDGRDDERIESLVKSCVLAAFAAGRDAGLREVYDFTKARVRGA